MTGATSPLGFPYLTNNDELTQIPVVMRQLAEAVDDYLSAPAAIAPTAPATATLATGWGGTAWYARRAGMVTLTLQVSRATFEPGYVILDPLPAGFRPVGVVKGIGLFGTAGRPFQINTAGAVTVDGNTSMTDGVFGTITYPV